MNGAALLIALIILLAWVTKPFYLISNFPGIFVMKANTALGLTLLGFSGWIASFPHKINRGFSLAAKGLALAPVLLGAATLLEYLLGWKLGIDQVFVKDNLNPQMGLPGRMGEGTALNFVLLGLVLAYPDISLFKKWRLAPSFLFVCMCVSTVALTGYLTNISEFYTYAPYNFIAWQTAVCFLLMCLALLMAQPNKVFITPTHPRLGLIPRNPNPPPAGGGLPGCQCLEVGG